MGLNQAGADHRKTSKYHAWLLPVAISVLAVVIALAGDSGREALRYDRIAIDGGELWRLLSGHLAHLGWPHLVMNLAGLFLIFYLVGTSFKPLEWLFAVIAIVLGIDLAFWLFEPQLIWYVGLSGLLHGCLAAGLIAGLRAATMEYRLLLGLLVLKILYEQLAGPLPGSEDTAGGNVLVDAHLYGALCGALLGGWVCFRNAPKAAI